MQIQNSASIVERGCSMKLKNVIWGLFFIVVGGIVALNGFGITNIDIFFDGWWTLFMIIPALIGLFTDREKLGHLIVLMVGIALFLMCNDMLDYDVIGKLILPIVLITIGLGIMFKNSGSKVKNEDIRRLNTKDEVCAVFREDVSKAPSKFDGVELDAIFGSVVYDLSESTIKKEALIKADAVFGSIKITVPKGVTVKLKRNAIFGDVISKASNEDEKTILYIDADAVFGSVMIYDK